MSCLIFEKHTEAKYLWDLYLLCAFFVLDMSGLQLSLGSPEYPQEHTLGEKISQEVILEDVTCHNT